MINKGDIHSNMIRDNETWNTCPKCFTDWKDEESTPGLLHRTRICDKCLRKRRCHIGKKLSPKIN